LVREIIDQIPVEDLENTKPRDVYEMVEAMGYSGKPSTIKVLTSRLLKEAKENSNYSLVNKKNELAVIEPVRSKTVAMPEEHVDGVDPAVLAIKLILVCDQDVNRVYAEIDKQMRFFQNMKIKRRA